MMSDDRIAQKRILHLIDSLGVGGTEKQLVLTIKQLGQDTFEHHVLVFNPNYDYFKDELMRCGVKIWYLPEGKRNYLMRFLEIVKLIKKVKPHVLHSWAYHHNFYAGVAGMAAGIRRRIGSVRNDYFRSIKTIKKMWRMLAEKTITDYVVNSKETYSQMISVGIHEKKINYIPNFVDYGNLVVSNQNVGADHQDSDRVFTLGIIGNLRKQKNHLMFVDVVYQVNKLYDVRGILAGQVIQEDPSVLLDLENQIRAYNLNERFSYLGFRPDVGRLFAEFDVFCLTSNFEGLPNVIIEAMAAGKPVVSTMVGAIPNLVEDGVTGFLVEPGDVSAFVVAVENLINDPELRIRMGEASRQTIEKRFNSTKIAEKFVELYREKL